MIGFWIDERKYKFFVDKSEISAIINLNLTVGGKNMSNELQAFEALSKEEITSGLFEAIKYGVAFDLELFFFIKENKDDLYSINILTDIIEWCCQIKADIIIKDEKDNNIRNKLNFGHTIGHAIESIYNIRHGEAVAYGMLCAAQISRGNNTLDKNQLDEIVTLINHFDLPKIIFDIEKIIEQLSKDKKRINGKNNFILLNSIGNSYISDNIEIDLIKNSISNLWTYL